MLIKQTVLPLIHICSSSWFAE